MKSKLLLILMLALIACSCSKDDDVIQTVPARHWVERTVALVAPTGDAPTKLRLERTAQWFLDNFEEAQRLDTLAVSLKIEWHDELTEDLQSLAHDLSTRTDVVAVIGPFGNEGIETFAQQCQHTQKPLIAPTATSEDVIRRYAVQRSGLSSITEPFLWSLTETDVRLVDILMNDYSTYRQYYKNNGEPLVACFAPQNYYGQTFNDWAPFFAEDHGLDIVRNEPYTDTDDLLSRQQSFIKDKATYASATFVALETAQQLYDVALMRRQLMLEEIGEDPANEAKYDNAWEAFIGFYPVMFALPGISQENIDALPERHAQILQGYEGYTPYADPSTGFELSYSDRFGVAPTFAECKLYDALMLAGFAASYAVHQSGADITDDYNKQMNQAIISITNETVSNRSEGSAVWNEVPMQQYLYQLEQGTLQPFYAASGLIRFDSDTYTSSTATTYLQWRLIDGKIVHAGYYGNASARTNDASAAWEYLYDRDAALSEYNRQISGATHYPDYGALSSQYAVLVQGSSDLKNYRHQADVLSVYQMLRAAGFDDDHIILILDGALASQVGGVVRTSVDGKDLLGGSDGLPKAVVDYDNATLTAQDVSNILLGQKTETTPVVLPQDARQNVFLYWSGHGTNVSESFVNAFLWRDHQPTDGFTQQLLQQTATQMMQNHQARKLFIVAEPCYGLSVISGVNGIPGVLAMSGASATEQTKCENWNSSLGYSGAWMRDRFTYNVVSYLKQNPSGTYRDLYLYCAEHTLSSHAQLVNAPYFGNLSVTTPLEFVSSISK